MADFLQRIEESGLCEKIEELQRHKCHQIYAVALKILEEHFSVNEGNDEWGESEQDEIMN